MDRLWLIQLIFIKGSWIESRTSSPCPVDQFLHVDGFCCEFCPIGKYMYKPCLSHGPRPLCIPCREKKTFMDEVQHNVTSCKHCSVCDPESEVEERDCNIFTNRQCVCREGLHRKGNECVMEGESVIPSHIWISVSLLIGFLLISLLIFLFVRRRRLRRQVDARARYSKNGEPSTRHLLSNTLDTDLVSAKTGEVTNILEEIPGAHGKTKHEDLGNEEHPDKDSNPKNAEADVVAGNLGLQEVTKDDLVDLTCVGKGSFGEVFKAKHKKWQNMVAVKKMQGSDWKKEVNNLMKAQHVCTVQILGLYKDSGTIVGLVLEWMCHGSVEDFNKKVNAGWALRLRLLHEVALGMNYLHCMEPKHLLHLDLKPANVLLNEHLKTKIADFGLCEVHHTTATVILKDGDPIGTLPYMAPERLDINEKQSRKWDIYSYALVIWAVMARSEPYEGVEKSRITLFSKAPHHQRPTIPEEATPYPDLIALMKQCWDKDPKGRPSFDGCAKRMKMMQKGENEIKEDVDKALSVLHDQRCSEKEVNKPIQEQRRSDAQAVAIATPTPEQEMGGKETPEQ